MFDDSQNAADMNWRLVEDAREAMARSDWMLALSLFEQSRRICINEGWRDGVHYADDMILDVFPRMMHQMEEDSRRSNKKTTNGSEGAASSDAAGSKNAEENTAAHSTPAFHEDRSGRRLRRIMSAEADE